MNKKWIFKAKLEVNWEIWEHKQRLVTKRYKNMQPEYGVMFATIVKKSSIRILLTLAVEKSPDF